MGDVVLTITSNSSCRKKHKAFADNYLTIVPLVERLKERGIQYIGTV